MKTHSIGIVMNGVTGRMGTNQHLVRSILEIREQGGIKVSDDEVIIPEPLLVGRNENKLKELSDRYGKLAYSTNLEKALADDNYPLYFDAQTTLLRYEAGEARHRRGQAYLLRKARGHDLGRRHGPVPARDGEGH